MRQYLFQSAVDFVALIIGLFLLTIVAALTLALGIGATTAIFSVVDAVLLHQVPYQRPSRASGDESRPDGGPDI